MSYFDFTNKANIDIFKAQADYFESTILLTTQLRPLSLVFIFRV